MDYIPIGSTDQSVLFHLDTGGLAVTGFNIGFIRWTRGDGTTFAETGPTALTALATITTAHTDNYGIYLDTGATGGSYFHFRADFPDAAFAAGADEVICHLYDDGNAVIASRIFRLDRIPVNVEQVGGVSEDIATESKQDTLATTIGTAGAGLTDLGGMSTGMKAEVNAEADTALTDYDTSNGVAKQSDLAQVANVIGSPPDLGSGANLSANNTDLDTGISAIETDTAEIGAAGAGLTDLGGMSTAMKAEVQAEAEDAITAQEPISANITQWSGSANIDTLTLVEWSEFILAALAGDVARSGDTYTYKKQDGSTTAFSYTVTTGGRS